MLGDEVKKLKDSFFISLGNYLDKTKEVNDITAMTEIISVVFGLMLYVFDIYDFTPNQVRKMFSEMHELYKKEYSKGGENGNT
jgi:hypothetical protein